MPRIKAGKMRHRIQMIDWTVAQNSYGEEDRTDSTTRSFNGQIIPLSSKEIMNGGQQQGYASHRLICRYDKANPLKSDIKLIYSGRTFNIVDIIDIDERQSKVVALLIEVIE